MLASLIELGSTSVTITKSANGQINLAVFAENKAPLSMVFTLDQLSQAEAQIEQYCFNQAAPVPLQAHQGEAVEKADAPKAQKAKKAPKATNTTASTPAPVQATPVQTTTPAQTGNFEDDLLAEFGL